MTNYVDVFRATIDPAHRDRLLAVRDEALAELRRRLPVFERAELVQIDDRTWLDVLVWSAPDGAEQAMGLSAEIPALVEMHELMNEVTRHERGTVEHRA